MSSTPLICCSSGVATDCSIVTASAPVYVVLTMICGGTMSGNWATGSPDIATKPPITVTIAITIATTGRLMNSLEIISVFLRRRFRVDGYTRPDSLDALDDHCFSRLQSLFDNPHRAALLTYFDCTRLDRIVVSDHSDLVSTL